MKYEYKFVKIELNFWFTEPKTDYHEAIERHASEGWRFVQLFAPATAGMGGATYFELIFERPTR